MGGGPGVHTRNSLSLTNVSIGAKGCMIFVTHIFKFKERTPDFVHLWGRKRDGAVCRVICSNCQGWRGVGGVGVGALVLVGFSLLEVRRLDQACRLCSCSLMTPSNLICDDAVTQSFAY